MSVTTTRRSPLSCIAVTLAASAVDPPGSVTIVADFMGFPGRWQWRSMRPSDAELDRDQAASRHSCFFGSRQIAQDVAALQPSVAAVELRRELGAAVDGAAVVD